MNPDKSWTVVHRTEVVFKTLDPAWNAFELPLAKLNNGDGDLPLLFQCYDWDKIGTDHFPILLFTGGFIYLTRNRGAHRRKARFYRRIHYVG
jgi:hypothetical protein